jgi:hypothetical protein
MRAISSVAQFAPLPPSEACNSLMAKSAIPAFSRSLLFSTRKASAGMLVSAAAAFTGASEAMVSRSGSCAVGTTPIFASLSAARWP